MILNKRILSPRNLCVAATQYATIGMGLFFLVQYTSFSDEVFKQHAARVGAIQKALLQADMLRGEIPIEHAMELAIPKANNRQLLDESFQVVFSTDCSGHLDWQSTLAFLSARRVGHEGPITRIASGCTPEDQQRVAAETARLDEGRGQFRTHFTPDYSIDEATGEQYVYYNKPHGFLHWLRSDQAPPKDSVIALCDPDFIFMKPLTKYIVPSDILFNKQEYTEGVTQTEVTRGNPVAQKFLIGDVWRTFNLTQIAGANSPAKQVNSLDADKHYSVGPPYILHADDALQIAKYWAKFVPRVHAEYPELLGEMYAYSIAAAHLKLPHTNLENYMTSDVGSWAEGWPFVDQMDSERFCNTDFSQTDYTLPTFLHYCQWYETPNGQYKFWKRDIRDATKVFSCDGGPSHPLGIPEPELVHAILHNTSATVNQAKELRYTLFQYCQLAMKVNQAQDDFKRIMC